MIVSSLLFLDIGQKFVDAKLNGFLNRPNLDLTNCIRGLWLLAVGYWLLVFNN